MSNKLPFYLLTFGTVIFIACLAANNKIKFDNRVNANIETFQNDTIIPGKSYKQDNVLTNEHLTGRLKPIRANFKRINSIVKWTAVRSEEISNSGEGGEVKYYYLNGQLEKIVSKQFGETFQQLNEYYLLNNQLSFAFEKTYKYNRPIYYDSAAMKAENDTEAFNFEKSEILEDRSYFEDGKLIHQSNNKKYGSHTVSYLLSEQKRIKEDFEKLLIRNKTTQ